MQAVILVGGLGTRLRPFTETIPKPMMDVNGKLFLELLLKRLSAHGVTEAILCTGYMSEKIESTLGSNFAGITLKYSVEKEQKGTAHALLLAKHLIADEFLFLFGDTYLRINYEDLFEEMHESECLGVVTAYSNPKKEFKNNLWVNDGEVEKYDKVKPEGNAVEAGVSVFRKSVLDMILPEDKSFESSVFPKLAAKKQLHAIVTDERFYDIGTPESLEYFRINAKDLVR